MQFKANFSADIPHLLNELNISLILSTYQAGKVIVIGSDGQNPYQLVRDFDRPMGMAFQDAWNIDLERLQLCCIHVIAANGKRIPFCAYYLTDINGRRLMDYDRGDLLK